MLYATPVHAVRDVHHVSDYHTIAEESVRFDPIGRLPSYHVARLTTKRILQQNSRVTPLAPREPLKNGFYGQFGV